VENTDWQGYVKGTAQGASISRSTVFKMVNNEYAAMDVLVRICMFPGCGMDDIVEIERQ